MRIKDSIKILVSLSLIIIILIYLYKEGIFNVVRQCDLFDFGILVLLTFSGYIVAGYQLFFLVKVQNEVSLKLSDLVLLPFSMSLFAYIIPANGGLLYSVFFLGKKYHVDSSKGFSIGIFSIYTSFIITGIIGLVVSVILGKIISWLMIVSLVCILSPWVVILCNRLYQRISFKKDSFLHRLQNYVNKVIVSSNDLIINKTTLFITIIINLLLILLLYSSYYWLTLIFGITISPVSLVFLMLLLRISSLIRILPGNLGIEELFAAGIFGLIGKDPAMGLLFALFIRLSAIVLFAPLGIFHTVFNLRYFTKGDFRSLLK